MKNTALKSDKYKKARGGPSRLLKICCAACGAAICLYQKDGPGMLKRMYVDRMSARAGKITAETCACAQCGKVVGVAMIYKKENRPAFRIIPGTVAKELHR